MIHARFHSSQTHRGILGVILILLIILNSGCTPARNGPGQWYVALDGNDRNKCSTALQPCKTIAAAIAKADSGGSIHIANGWYYENLTISKEISLIGESMEQTVLDGGKTGSVILFKGTANAEGMDFSLNGLTLTGGLAERGGGVNISGGRSVKLHDVKIIGNEANDRGGGIFSNYARLLVLDGVQLLNNKSVNEGGGIYYIGGPVGYAYYGLEVLGSTISGNEAMSGGGIYADGVMNITDTLIESNTASVDGGGIFNMHEANIVLSKVNNNSAALTGGGICSEDMDMEGNRLVVAETTVDGNNAKQGAGIYNRGFLTLEGSTVSNNIAADSGGGVWDGGVGNGRYNYFYSINSTVSGNQAVDGGGIWGGQIRTNGFFAGHIELVNLTIANNKGKGIYTHAGAISLRNVLLSSNTGGNCDITTELAQKNNLSNDASCNSFVQSDLLIGPLADNGGPTFTHRLLPGSPAIDRAIDTAGLVTDQRNYQRPRDGNWDNVSDMDIGSYEADYPVAPEN
jgi:hypothetical protein